VEGAAVGELLDDDGLHPNEAGQEALADAYGEAIDRHCSDTVLGS
jgi:lysophospholipase L1-like esterase